MVTTCFCLHPTLIKVKDCTKGQGQGLVPILSARSECVATSLTRGRWQGNPKTLGASGSQVKGQGQGKPPPQ